MLISFAAHEVDHCARRPGCGSQANRFREVRRLARRPAAGRSAHEAEPGTPKAFRAPTDGSEGGQRCLDAAAGAEAPAASGKLTKEDGRHSPGSTISLDPHLDPNLGPMAKKSKRRFLCRWIAPCFSPESFLRACRQSGSLPKGQDQYQYPPSC